MKTTIEIADGVLEDVRKLARREGTTIRSLVEEGLRLVLGRRRGKQRFRLRKASFRGAGLRPEVREGSWETIRELIYERRGGS